MNSLYNNLHLLPELKNIIENGVDKYYEYSIINNNPITNNTISIVMTSHERSKQVYFTLNTINNSSFKDIQVILVDDSDNDVVLISELKKYPFNIEFIKINRNNKVWYNPCINYNIGFKYIKGDKVIIQNSEVCHIGDVLSYISLSVSDNNYYVFDVRNSDNYEQNEVIYSNINNLNSQFINNSKLGIWYQHYIHNNRCYHFLCALTKSSFDKINGFSYDYAFGSSYDDDDILIKIRDKLQIINIKNDENNVAGIHLFHGYGANHPINREWNEQLCNKKKNYYNIHKKYLEVSDGNTIEEIKVNFNILKSI